MTRICASRTYVDGAKLAGHIPIDPERAQGRCWPLRPVKFGSSIHTEVRHSSALRIADESMKELSILSLLLYAIYDYRHEPWGAFAGRSAALMGLALHPTERDITVQKDCVLTEMIILRLL